MKKVVDDAGPLGVTVDMVEDVACGLHRQRGDFRTLAARGDCCDTGSDKNAYFLEPTQLIHHRIDLLGTRSFRVENGLDVVKDYERLL